MSTYRLQLHAGFTFAHATEIVPYLAALGVTDCYISPPFTATPGSMHGYDAGNPNEINPELGGVAAFEQFVAALRAADMGLVVDFVPNHMSNDPLTNPWWRDVLENGPSSPFAHYFDIDWDPIKPELKDRLLLPILGEQYGDALDGGKLQVQFDEGGLVVAYGTHRVPVNPRRVPLVFDPGLTALAAEHGDDDRDVREFLGIMTALRNLPPYTERDPAAIARRAREKVIARTRLADLVDRSMPIRRFVDRSLAEINGTPGRPATFDRLHDLLELQAYRLASWRTAADEINYRRFFDINELSGLRVEVPDVFDHIHRLVLRLIGDGSVTGLRLDHIDGLADPAGYLARLRTAIETVRPPGGARSPFYVVAEKILTGDETLREDWAVDGTTGYAFLNDLNGVFVSRRNAHSLVRVNARLTSQADPLAEVIYESKRLIVGTDMTSESQVLASTINRLSERDRRSRDFTFGSIRRALREVVACFPVYRTYVSRAGISGVDRAIVDQAIRAARSRNAAMEPSIFEFIRRVLLPERGSASRGSAAEDDFEAHIEVAIKFQQFTAPVQAKGIEDTAFYRHTVLLSLNEVGGDPARVGRSVEALHAASARRLARWPREMNATTTHDTKRGEDARARLNVLSELPSEWRDAVSVWMRGNQAGRSRAAGGPAPDQSDEYHFYQALLAIWPMESEHAGVPAQAPADLVARIQEYMRKAIREAKRHTSWVNQNAEYEDGVARFVDRALLGEGAAGFLATFVPFARRVARLGAINGLAQLVVKIASPGVPDFYQGTELWHLTLVDPDNRRDVDFRMRRAWLDALEPFASGLDHTAPADDRAAAATGLADLLDNWPDGRIKLLVTAIGLRLRRAHPALFQRGEYIPMTASGWRAGHVVAFARRCESDLVIAVVPRLTETLCARAARWPMGPDVWKDTRLRVPETWAGRWFRNALTGERLQPLVAADAGWLTIATALASCPVAVLIAESSSRHE